MVGWDGGRLSVVLAVLEARAGLAFGGHDIYLNVAGGLRIQEPAADLAAAAALTSSLTGEPVPAGAVVFGEIGLSGEVRPVAHGAARLKEAAKLGFSRALTPQPSGNKKKSESAPTEITLQALGQVSELIDLLAPAGPRRSSSAQNRDGA